MKSVDTNLVVCSRCGGNAAKHDPPFYGACYLCGGAQKISKELAAAYQLYASGLDNKRPTRVETARLIRAVSSGKQQEENARVKCPICTYFEDNHGNIWITGSPALCESENLRRLDSDKMLLWDLPWEDRPSPCIMGTCGLEPIAFVECPLCEGKAEVVRVLDTAYRLALGDEVIPIYRQIVEIRENFECGACKESANAQ